MCLSARRRGQKCHGTYLPKDEESIGAVRRERVCVTSIAGPGSKDKAYSTNVALKRKGIINCLEKLNRVMKKLTALLKPYRDTIQGVKAAAGM